MTPGDNTEPMSTSGSSTSGTTAPKFPRRPEDVDQYRAQAKAEKEKAKEAEKTAQATRAAEAAQARTAPRTAPAAPARAGGAPSGSTGASAGTATAAGGAATAVATRPGGSTAPAGQRPAPRPAAKPTARPAARTSSGGRRVKLTLSRIDPWSALKMSFLLSVALGIAMVVAVAALWLILKGMGAFDAVNNLVGSIIQDGDKKFDIMDFVGFGRVVSLAVVFAVIDVFLLTAIATLGSFIYNVSASLVGGLGLTLTDD